MGYTEKDWKDDPDHTTPLSAVAIEDLETRVTDYTDLKTAISVKEPPYNAVGDGNADDTTGIQATIDAVGATGGGVVFFPPGTYKITDKLTVDDDNVTLAGTGTSSQIVMAAGSDMQVLRVNTTADDTGAVVVRNFTMRDLYVDHNGDEQASAGSGINSCLTAWQTISITFQNVYVYMPLDGGITPISCLDIRIKDCTVEKVVWSLAGNGINVTGGTGAGDVDTDVVVEGCIIKDNNDIGIALGSINAARVICRGCIVKGNYGTAGGNMGIIAEGSSTANSQEIVISGCTVSDQIGYGIGCQTGGTVASTPPHHDTVSITGNTVTPGVGSMGIIATGVRNVSITGNVINDFPTYGIVVGDNAADYEESNISISGNTIRALAAATGPGILLQKGDVTNYLRKVTVTGNTLEGQGASTFGIHVYGRVKQAVISQNGIYNWLTGIRPQPVGASNPTYITMIGNMIQDNANYGISADGTCTQLSALHNDLRNNSFSAFGGWPAGTDSIKEKNWTDATTFA